jgi:hypothetical protein
MCGKNVGLQNRINHKFQMRYKEYLTNPGGEKKEGKSSIKR